MLKVINVILFSLTLYSLYVEALEHSSCFLERYNLINNRKIKQCGREKQEQGSYNVNSQKISSSSSVRSSALYTPSLFLNNSIFSGDNNRDDDDDDDEKKNKLYKGYGYYYNIIPDNTKDIDIIILLVDGLVAFLSSSDISFNEGYNEFIERLYLVILFIRDSSYDQYCNKSIINICNRIRHDCQLSLYSEDSLFSKNLDIQQKKQIIESLPKQPNIINSNEEYCSYIGALKIFLQKLIVGFIWVNDLENISSGSIIIDTDKVFENAQLSQITSIENLKDEVSSNRAFFYKNKNLQIGCLRKDSKKYKKKFLDSNVMHEVYLKQEENPAKFLSDLFRQAINKRLIEQKPDLKKLPDSAIDIINIIAKGFNYQKIILFIEKIKDIKITKFLTEVENKNIQMKRVQQANKNIVFLKLNIKDVLEDTILEKIKLRMSRQELAEIIISILGEETNEVIYQLKTFLQKKAKQIDDIESLKSTSSEASINDTNESYPIFDPIKLRNNLTRFLFSISCNDLSNDRILFFIDFITKENLYYLAKEEDISYEEFYNSNTILQDKKELLRKILKESKNINSTAKILFDVLSETDKIKINKYFNDISTTQ
jgi:hypothetical protein